MRALLDRYRHGSLLGAVLLIQLFLLGYQIKGENDIRLLRLWAVAAITPVEKVVRTVVDASTSLFENYIALYDARQENRRLQAELDRSRLRIRELAAVAAQADELSALLELKRSSAGAPLVAARVISASPGAITRTVTIDRGRDAGLEPNMVVLTPEGVVGKVVSVFPGVSQVLLITDQKSGVGVRVGRTDVQGVVKGTGGQDCRLEYVPAEETVPMGEEVLTSGQDQVFPRGLPVGRVTSVEPGEESFQIIKVQPAARLTHLDHVLVLAGPPETLATAAQAKRSAGQALTR
ncbi:MAG: rod shape-determining protein MreC [Terriglobia bacterium]